MDIDLGGLVDGIDTAIAIKKMHQVPMIFLTASSSQSDIDRAKMVPADGFIVKPFNDTDIRVALTLAIPDTARNFPNNRISSVPQNLFLDISLLPDPATFQTRY